MAEPRRIRQAVIITAIFAAAPIVGVLAVWVYAHWVGW